MTEHSERRDNLSRSQERQQQQQKVRPNRDNHALMRNRMLTFPIKIRCNLNRDRNGAARVVALDEMLLFRSKLLALVMGYFARRVARYATAASSAKKRASIAGFQRENRSSGPYGFCGKIKRQRAATFGAHFWKTTNEQHNRRTKYGQT